MSLVCSQRATAPPSSIESKAESAQLSPPHPAAVSAGIRSPQGKGGLELPFPNATESRESPPGAWAAPTFGLNHRIKALRYGGWKGEKEDEVPRKTRLSHSSPAPVNGAGCAGRTRWCLWFVSPPSPWDSCTRKTKLNILTFRFRSNSLLFPTRTHSGKESKRRLQQPPFSKALVFLLNLKQIPYEGEGRKIKN